MRESFVMYTRADSATFKVLSDEQKGKLFTAIFDYVQDIEPKISDGMILVAFEQIKQHLDTDYEKWLQTCEERRIAGREGGLAKAKNAKDKTEKEPPRKLHRGISKSYD